MKTQVRAHVGSGLPSYTNSKCDKSPRVCFVTQLRSLPGSSPRTAPGKRKGPVAETLGNLVGAEGLRRRSAPAPRCGARRALRATLENARAFPQLRSLPGSSPRTAPGKRKGPVAETLGNLVGAEGLEPSILAARDFKSPAYANSATPPLCELVYHDNSGFQPTTGLMSSSPLCASASNIVAAIPASRLFSLTVSSSYPPVFISSRMRTAPPKSTEARFS